MPKNKNKADTDGRFAEKMFPQKKQRRDGKLPFRRLLDVKSDTTFRQ